MKLCTFARTDGVPRAGAVRADGTIVDLAAADATLPPTLRGVLTLGAAGRSAVARAVAGASGAAIVERAAVRMLPPIGDPGKILCIGLNYRDHAAEVNLDLPTSITVFAKWANGLAGDGEPVRIPRESDKVDYEAELGVVIGRPARRVSEADALTYVAGYMCMNDVSVRDYQMRTSQWTLGKAFDTHLPCGPWIVTTDDVPDPQRLGIRCSVDGETLQSSTTAEMVFGVARIVADLSTVMTLEPGDLIATGTPAGVGTSRTPRRWLRPGERVRVEVDGVGAIENPLVAD